MEQDLKQLVDNMSLYIMFIYIIYPYLKQNNNKLIPWTT